MNMFCTKLSLALLLALMVLVHETAAFVPSLSLQRPHTTLRSQRARASPRTLLSMANGDVDDRFGFVSVVLLAGGVGSRMKANVPKQFLELRGEPVLHHTLKLFLNQPVVSEVVLVVDPKYEHQFESFRANSDGKLRFAPPGKERQDSVFNGISTISDECDLVCIHDAARPLITQEAIFNVLGDAKEHGAAVLGVPMKATVKESADGEFVERTIPRSRLWEIQTPQVIVPSILREGFEKVKAEGLEVTDDVSIVEQLGLPVKITMGEYTNLKLTTPDDMQVADSILAAREESK